MKTCVYAIKDAALSTYAAPFTQPNNQVAMRAFGDLANDPQSNLSRHPSDYALVRLGTFDDETGKFESEEPTTIAWAVDFHEQKPEETGDT